MTKAGGIQDMAAREVIAELHDERDKMVKKSHTTICRLLDVIHEYQKINALLQATLIDAFSDSGSDRESEDGQPRA